MEEAMRSIYLLYTLSTYTYHSFCDLDRSS